MKKVFIDLTGKIFGDLTVIRRAPTTYRDNGKRIVSITNFECMCKCGNVTIVNAGMLTCKKGGTKSCGCSKIGINHLGAKYGRLTVIKRVEKPSHIGISRDSFWFCICNCGAERIIAGGDLKRNKSCGCIRKHVTVESAYLGVASNIYRARYSDGNISFEQFLELSQYNCFYCNIPPSNKHAPYKTNVGSTPFAAKHGIFIYNGLDRINQEMPHDIDNVVACCKKCNLMKRNNSQHDFIQHIRAIFNNLNGKNQ